VGGKTGMVKQKDRQKESAGEKAKRLFMKNYGKWLGYALKHNITRDDAEDLIQDLAVKFLEKQDNLAQLPDQDLEAYMMASLKNAIRNSLARTKRAEPLEEGTLPAEESTEEIVLTHLEYENVKEAVKQLPEIQRDIVYMNYYQNIETARIAEKTGMAGNAVRANKSRAVKLLRRILAAME